MRQLIAIIALLLAPRIARADHANDGSDMTTSGMTTSGMDMSGMDMSGMDMSASESHPAMPQFTAAIQLVAASFDQTYFAGSYDGVVPSLMWMRGRWMACASIGIYRVYENGVQVYGPGDVMLHGSFAIVNRTAVQAGVELMLTAPTGNMLQGLGMGDPMLMPHAWASWKPQRRITLSASGGWGVMLGHMSDEMVMNIVDPMNESEFEWKAAVDVAIGKGVHAQAHADGGVPVGEPGLDRVIGALRVGWANRRVDAAAEVQTGFAGDPFHVRGLVETAFHF